MGSGAEAQAAIRGIDGLKMGERNVSVKVAGQKGGSGAGGAGGGGGGGGGYQGGPRPAMSPMGGGYPGAPPPMVATPPGAYPGWGGQQGPPQQQGYGAPMPMPGYAPAPAYGAPPPAYGAPQAPYGYGAPPPAYGYSAPPPAYGYGAQPPPAYGGYGGPQGQGMGPPPTLQAPTTLPLPAPAAWQPPLPADAPPETKVLSEYERFMAEMGS